MFQATRRDCELECLLACEPGKRSVNYPGGEAISRADAVDDMGDLIAAARQELFAVVQTSRPAVMRSAHGLTQRNRDRPQVRISGLAHAAHASFSVLPRHSRVCPRLDVRPLLLPGRAYTWTSSSLADANASVSFSQMLGHHLARRLAPLPEILPVIEIAGNRESRVVRLAH